MTLKASRLPPIPAPSHAHVAPGKLNTIMDPYDPTDTNWQRWMPGQNTSSGNEVVPYIEGSKAFADIAAAIRTATGPEHFIYLLGWNLEDFDLVLNDPTTNVPTMLQQASAAGVQIRAMLYKHSPHVQARDNTSAVAFINNLPTGAAIHDSRVLHIEFNVLVPQLLSFEVGAHHQKILLIKGSHGLVAFQGGMDLDPNRRPHGGDPGLYDAHTRIMGPSAYYLYQIFAERWTDHPESGGLKPINKSVPAPASHTSADLFVHVAKTYGNGSTHPGVPPSGYAFAPAGTRTAKALVLKAIAATKRFIYLEDQYLVDMAISQALRNALAHVKKVIILICPSDGVRGELYQVDRRRKDFIDNIKAGGADKVHVCELDQYVHAKLWVFDDRFSIIGSANVNRRGFTHDSEQLVGVFDVNKKKKWFFAHELRMHLWARHLGLSPLDVHDAVASSVHWSDGNTRGHVRTFVPDPSKDLPPPQAFPVSPDYLWNAIIDPDGS